MARVVAFIFLAMSSLAPAADEGQERLKKCEELLADFDFGPSAQSRVNMALTQIRLAIGLGTNPVLVAPTTEQAPLGREAFLQHLLDLRTSQLEIRGKTQLALYLRTGFIPLASEVDIAMGLPETYGTESVPAILVYTLNVLDGLYGADEKKLLLDTLEASDQIPSSGKHQKSYPIPRELLDRYNDLTRRELGGRQGVRFLHASLLFATNRLKAKD